MFKYTKSKLKIYPQDSGFITLEIIVSIIIALAFVAVSMQSLVYAMAMKVQAQEKQKANLLIQEDIELANQLGLTPLAVTGTAPVCNAANYDDGYAKKLWDDLIATGGATPEERVLRKIKSSGGSDDGEEEEIGKTLGLRRIDMSGTSDSPHRTLKVAYQVWFRDSGNYVDKNGVAYNDADSVGPIAETYVEVIPSAALECS